MTTPPIRMLLLTLALVGAPVAWADAGLAVAQGNTEDHRMPDTDVSPGPIKLSPRPSTGSGAGDGVFKGEYVDPDWSPPSWMVDGAVEAEKSSSSSGKKKE